MILWNALIMDLCIVRFMHFYLHEQLLMDAQFSANDGEFAIWILGIKILLFDLLFMIGYEWIRRVSA